MEQFRLKPGFEFGGKYEVQAQLGAGWEGEVYRVLERPANIERAAKFFYPSRSQKGRSSLRYARKLHTLRNCPVVIQCHTQETVEIHDSKVPVLISEYVEGELLSDFLARQAGKKLHFFEGLHLLHALARGMEKVHELGEYHGDLHLENIMVQRSGLGFELKLLDFYYRGRARRQNIEDDVCDMIRVFYDVLGGSRSYPKLRAEAKDICCGLKRSLILGKFRTAGELRGYLDSLEWV